jgi:glycerol-3-phosphate dehydrogenase (NAD(P)+)
LNNNIDLELKIGIIGAGSWGTALTNLLANKGYECTIYDINASVLDDIANNSRNTKYLPDVHLNTGIKVSYDIAGVAGDKDIVLFCVPAQVFRRALSSALEFLTSDQLVVNVAKGIEQGSLSTISQIAMELAPQIRYTVLSGPSHAEEVAQDMPTTVAVASKAKADADYVQEVFSTKRFRVYTNTDVYGLELGGSLKNIIALGAGISDGMGFGDNTKAALMTRGLAEMVRLGESLGAKAETFYGLSGIGDLIVTCTSMHSRNRRCGILIGEGMDAKKAEASIGMVVEGMFSAKAAYELSKRAGVELPITEGIYRIINGETDAREALTELMSRPKKEETVKK